MKLTEFEPQFFRYDVRVEDVTMVAPEFRARPSNEWRAAGGPTVIERKALTYLLEVESLAAAQGIRFLCPKCFRDNGGAVGTHGVNVAFKDRGVPHNAYTGLPRWNVSGSGYADLSITPSVLVVVGCGWHGYITNGEVSIL